MSAAHAAPITRSRPASAANVAESLYPFTSHWHDRGGGLAMHYLDEGPRDAEPIVMVHGNPSWSFYFRELVLGLRGKHRVLVPFKVDDDLFDQVAQLVPLLRVDLDRMRLASLFDQPVQRRNDLLIHRQTPGTRCR